IQAGSTMPSVELPRKRKGEVEERQSLNFNLEDDLSRSEGEDQQVKMKCFREPHRQIEKRRRDKMNNLIDELSAMIPACQPMARKLDKLTVLRKAVQHLKALKAGASGAFADAKHKPSILPQDDLRHLLLKAADGFLLVVRCDRAKILFISESVSKILNFSKLELTGQSLFDFIHPKDIHKVKEQLSSSEMLPQQCLVDASTGVQVQAEAPARPSHLTTGARRSFFCRMKHSRVTRKHEGKHSLPAASKKKGCCPPERYCTLHCTGYMRTWPSGQLDPEGDAADKETPSLNCLVTVCRLHPHVSHQPPNDVNVKATEFVTRCAIDGKFTFVDQQATTVIGYLPQEVLGTSCYEYFHQDDLQHMAGKHRQVLRSKEKIETQCYKFKTKHGPYVTLQSQWFSFTNPWTKEVEFIVSSNRVISSCLSHLNKAMYSFSIPSQKQICLIKLSENIPAEEAQQIPEIPGLSTGVGTMIYAGSIGTQIANELSDTYSRANSSPSSGASSPFGSVQTPSREEEAGSSSTSQSQADSSKEAAKSSGAPESEKIQTIESESEPSQLDLDVPGLSSFSSDEAAMAVIMSLLETDVNMSQTGDFEDLHWPF
uniref:Basic helix-loop-helix ARNT like 2 n=1 Tax=Poecilia formosa TaxID=48698 RepID=A0A087Y1S3_POEFO